jgi:hypothetical protein
VTQLVLSSNPEAKEWASSNVQHLLPDATPHTCSDNDDQTPTITTENKVAKLLMFLSHSFMKDCAPKLSPMNYG